jgi:flagellum-specific peptidoglycan hydrolase FlgJ
MFYSVRMFWPKIQVSAAIPLAQAYHESAAWTSDLYNRAYNMFGMKMPTVRSTTALGPSGQYANYRSPLDSIRDYFKRLDYYGITTDEELIADIKKNYATDPRYFQKVDAARTALAPSLISPAFAEAVTSGLTVAACYGAYRGLNALLDA